MRAGYYVGNHSYEVRETPDLIPQKDEVKIEVAWCGLCGTDIHKFEGKNGASMVTPPIILGHECSGIVAAVGPDVQNFRPGDHVAADPSYGCGKCEYCQQGYPNFCIERHGVAKGFADYVYPPEKNVYHLPEGMNLKAAAFAEPLSCVIHGLDLLSIKSGSTVAIYGMGAIGSLFLQLLKSSGAAKVIVIEKEASKRELAMKLGADMFVLNGEILAVAKIVNIDYVIECIGLKFTMEQCFDIAGRNGKILFFGLGNPNEVVSFNQFLAYTKELSVYTSYLNPLTMKRAISILSSSIIDYETIISAELSLDEIGEELKKKEFSRKGKVLVRLSGKL